MYQICIHTRFGKTSMAFIEDVDNSRLFLRLKINIFWLQFTSIAIKLIVLTATFVSTLHHNPWHTCLGIFVSQVGHWHNDYYDDFWRFLYIHGRPIKFLSDGLLIVSRLFKISSPIELMSFDWSLILV